MSEATIPTATTAPQPTQAAPDTLSADPTKAATEAGPPSDATPAEIRKWKVKIDGAEAEVDEPELLRGYERAKGSHKRFEEAAKLRKEIEQREAEFAETVRLVRDPRTSERALAKLLGGEEKLAEIAERVIMRRLELDALPEPERKRRQQMTERERQIEEQERALAQREAEIKKRRDAETAQRAQALQEQFAREWPPLLKAAGVPASRVSMARMAATMREALSHGIDMTPQEAAQTVAEEMRQEYRALAADADPDTLTGLLGEHAEKVRAAKIASVQAQPGRKAPAEQPPAARERREPAPPPTFEELRKRWSR
jgi:hypothetical protein